MEINTKFIIKNEIERQENILNLNFWFDFTFYNEFCIYLPKCGWMMLKFNRDRSKYFLFIIKFEIFEVYFWSSIY